MDRDQENEKQNPQSELNNMLQILVDDYEKNLDMEGTAQI